MHITNILHFTFRSLLINILCLLSIFVVYPQEAVISGIENIHIADGTLSTLNSKEQKTSNSIIHVEEGTLVSGLEHLQQQSIDRHKQIYVVEGSVLSGKEHLHFSVTYVSANAKAEVLGSSHKTKTNSKRRSSKVRNFAESKPNKRILPKTFPCNDSLPFPTTPSEKNCLWISTISTVNYQVKSRLNFNTLTHFSLAVNTNTTEPTLSVNRFTNLAISNYINLPFIRGFSGLAPPHSFLAS